MELPAPVLYLTALGLIGWGLFWFLRRQDEIPLLMAGFNALFIRRLFAIDQGFAQWTTFDYGLIFTFDSYANHAATYLLLGAVTLIVTYCLAHKIPDPVEPNEEFTFRTLLWKHRMLLIAGFMFFTAMCLILRVSFDDDALQMIEASSYAYLFSLAYSAFVILLFLLAIAGRATHLVERLIIGGVIVVTAFLTVGPSLRFSFLGWAPAILLIATRDLKPVRRFAALVAIGLVITFIFAVAGARRNPELADASAMELLQEGVEVAVSQNDANMLDGFIMVIQVFPMHMDYRYGMEHLEIATRPIPRSWWPDKPVGGWQQRYAQETGMDLFTTGISPSMYGSFFMEFGVAGIIIFSALYGWLFARYVNWANGYHSTLRWVLRSLLIASSFALIRGGDMPGIIAFIGMSYWPIAGFMWLYHRLVRKQSSQMRFA